MFLAFLLKFIFVLTQKRTKKVKTIYRKLPRNIRSYISCLKLRFAIPLFTHYFWRSSS